MNNSRIKYLIGAIIIGAAFAYLMWTSFRSSFQFALTPAEFLEKQLEYQGKSLKIAGTVLQGSLLANNSDYYFRVASDPEHAVSVHYKGIAPNTFREGADVVVGGTFNTEADIFEAKEMITKCASKYENR